jgi:hypothetical protein
MRIAISSSFGGRNFAGLCMLASSFGFLFGCGAGRFPNAATLQDEPASIENKRKRPKFINFTNIMIDLNQ